MQFVLVSGIDIKPRTTNSSTGAVQDMPLPFHLIMQISLLIQLKKLL